MTTLTQRVTELEAVGSLQDAVNEDIYNVLDEVTIHLNTLQAKVLYDSTSLFWGGTLYTVRVYHTDHPARLFSSRKLWKAVAKAHAFILTER